MKFQFEDPPNRWHGGQSRSVRRPQCSSANIARCQAAAAGSESTQIATVEHDGARSSTRRLKYNSPPPLVGLGRKADQGWGEGALPGSHRSFPRPAPSPTPCLPPRSRYPLPRTHSPTFVTLHRVFPPRRTSPPGPTQENSACLDSMPFRVPAAITASGWNGTASDARSQRRPQARTQATGDCLALARRTGRRSIRSIQPETGLRPGSPSPSRPRS